METATNHSETSESYHQTQSGNPDMQSLLRRDIREIIAKGGPEPSEYPLVTAWFHAVHTARQDGDLLPGQRHMLIQSFGEAFSTKTMQGFCLHKPHGYAGDYETIDRIYQQDICRDPDLMRWDLYFHAQSACRAVRNRKQYFGNMLSRLIHLGNGPIQVLNVGSGPGRDMHDFFSQHGNVPVTIDCIDQDKNAIAFAKNLCHPFDHQLTFHNWNVFRYKSAKRYDLIWSAGLFDYLNDRLFSRLLKHLYSMLAEGGELVVGNFSPGNPTLPYMQLAEWHLIHRDAESLENLVLASNIGPEPALVRVGAECEGVNLFLHIRK